MKRLPLLMRILAVAAVAILILVPIGLIKGKVLERQARADSVVRQFAAETSNAQRVAGPFLALTCEDTAGRECPTQFFAPRVLKAAGTMPVEARHRGIYPIRLYRADLKLSGEFEWPAPPVPAGGGTRTWKRAYLVMLVSDPRGIKAFSSSVGSPHLAQAAERDLEAFTIREKLDDYAPQLAGTQLAFAYRINLLGTSSLQVAPIGDTTEIELSSDWPHPSFGEAWSPDERDIGSAGFRATWRMNSIATGGQSAWNRLAREGKLATHAGAGVSLFDPINVYSLSYRATEYAFLFVLFTFAALGLTEVLAGIRLHPVQYALTGLAIAVFFLLLLALSEHIAFLWAYATAAVACVTLLTFYLRHPLGSLGRSLVFFGFFSALYATLYQLLQSEDNALLMGSIMTFAILAFAMIATRKLDWEALAGRMITSPAP